MEDRELEFITRPYFFQTFIKPNIATIIEELRPSNVRFTILESTSEILSRLISNRKSFAIVRMYAQSHERISFSQLKEARASIYIPAALHPLYMSGSLALKDIPSVTPSFNHDLNEICMREINARSMNDVLIQAQVFTEQIIEEALTKGAKTFLLDHHAREAVASGKIVKIENEDTKFWVTFACAKDSSDDMHGRVLSVAKRIIKNHTF